MTRSPKLSATLTLALTAVAVSAFAYTTAGETSKTRTAANDAPPVTVNVDEHAMAPAADEAPAPVTTGNPAAVPDIEHYSLPPVTVTAPRPSEDELLRNAVVDRLAADSRIAGTIGVESYRHVVSLTGRVTTTGQAERAEAIARGVEGVKDVNNFLTARVGRI